MVSSFFLFDMCLWGIFNVILLGGILSRGELLDNVFEKF